MPDLLVFLALLLHREVGLTPPRPRPRPRRRRLRLCLHPHRLRRNPAGALVAPPRQEPRAPIGDGRHVRDFFLT